MHQMSSSDGSLYIALNSCIAFRRCMRSDDELLSWQNSCLSRWRGSSKTVWLLQLRQHELRCHVSEPSNYAHVKYLFHQTSLPSSFRSRMHFTRHQLTYHLSTQQDKTPASPSDYGSSQIHYFHYYSPTSLTQRSLQTIYPWP
jgi:hypothetical protein